ncbi:MAG: hypothetical protein IAF38_14600 [Bacteroidia bacterium]|nr:hypothetical protein [Bacteroidia bacterium]
MKLSHLTIGVLLLSSSLTVAQTNNTKPKTKSSIKSTVKEVKGKELTRNKEGKTVTEAKNNTVKNGVNESKPSKTIRYCGPCGMG